MVFPPALLVDVFAASDRSGRGKLDAFADFEFFCHPNHAGLGGVE